MSVRIYRGAYNQSSRNYPPILIWTTTGLAIAAQMVYPLLPEDRLLLLTISTVLLFSVANLVHAWISFGAKYALMWWSISLLFGLIVEEVGIHSAWPFGEYAYSADLGWAIYDVPLLIPFAWTMLTHPILLLARRLSWRWAPLIFAWALMAWDLFLDPLMVDAGRWSWSNSSPRIPGIAGIPLSNAAGWLLSALALGAILHWTLPKNPRNHSEKFGSPDVILGWTLASGVIGNFFYFERPGTALVGGLAFGAALVPYFFTRWINRE